MSFDPNAFLDAQTEEANARRAPLPADGTIYTAIIKGLKTATGIIEKGERTGEPWLQVIVPIHIEVPPQLQDALKLPPSVVISDGVFLDLTPSKTIDNAPGRNRRQRQYREALGMNQPGFPWSWRKAEGQPIRVTIRHGVYDGEIQDRIDQVLKF